MARNEVTVNVQLDDKQLKSLADEIRETFAKRIDELESRIAKVREICEAASKPCAYDQTGVCTHEENAINPAELLAVLDGVGEKATGGILKPGEVYVVGESGCSLSHMSLPKAGKPTGRKVTIHVGDPALREVIDKIRARDCTEDAAYDKDRADA